MSAFIPFLTERQLQTSESSVANFHQIVKLSALIRMNYVHVRGVRVEHFSYPTRAENCYLTRPAGIPVPVGLPLLGIIGLVAYHHIVLVLMNLFSVLVNICYNCMYHHHNYRLINLFAW